MSPNPETCPNCQHADRHSHMVGCLHVQGNAYCPCPDLWKPRAQVVADDLAARDAALASVEANSDADWVAAAEAAVKDLAARGEAFTTDDVWDHLAATGAPPVHDPRALGPVMKRAQRAGTIQGNAYVASRRRHGSPIRLYTAGGAA